jgi:hypothetical protein
MHCAQGAAHVRESGKRRPAARGAAAAAVLGLLLSSGVAADDPPGTPTSREALELCHRGQAGDSDADALLARSLELADQAIAADDRDPLAYFARFCALGEQARRSGVSLSSLVKLWAIRDAVDHTLALAPQFPGALFGKGALLCSLPRLLGGDAKAGEKLIVEALRVDPDYVEARLFYGDFLDQEGRSAAAREEADRALSAAERKHDADDVAAARQLIGRIGGTR